VYLKPLFHDRADAGRQLADLLLPYKDSAPIVLGLPRGGVPVAFEIARALHAPLDVALVRKIGAPHHPEVGIGAVVDGGDPQIVLNDEVVRMVEPSTEYIRTTTARELAELERRRKTYRGDTPSPSLADRSVIVVDDGIATGGTVRAVLRGIQRTDPAAVVLAVPVAPWETVESLKKECDHVVCIYAPELFSAVGAYYNDISQTTDAQVVDLLAKSRPAQNESTAQGKSVRGHARNLQH
jgi:putative phosphoribosyl transferase